MLLAAGKWRLEVWVLFIHLSPVKTEGYYWGTPNGVTF